MLFPETISDDYGAACIAGRAGQHVLIFAKEPACRGREAENREGIARYKRRRKVGGRRRAFELRLHVGLVGDGSHSLQNLLLRPDTLEEGVEQDPELAVFLWLHYDQAVWRPHRKRTQHDRVKHAEDRRDRADAEAE